MSEAYYIGMDLCSDSTQISFYNDISREPETVNQLNNKETYMMPNILFFGLETGESVCWLRSFRGTFQGAGYRVG